MTIVKRHPIAVLLLALSVGAVIWFLTPVYGFKAHLGKLPLPPTGWQELPDDAPTSQEIFDPAIAAAGSRALEAIAAHRARIAAPALSAAVAIDGQLVWAGVTGWSDLADGKPATTATRFRIGSTSKIITATLLARLTQRGMVDLDAPISTYWDPLPNPVWAPITLRQLASHMSGLPHYKENTDLTGLYQTIALRRHYADLRDAVAVFDESELLHAPGSAFHYSTLGTVLLGVVLSQRTDTPYRALVRDEVLTPLELNSVVVAPTSADRGENFATSYFARDGEFRQWRPVDMSHRLSGGGFAATSSDLARLGVAWLDERYLSAATREQFWQPQRLADGAINSQNYALGFRWVERPLENGEILRHANHGGVSRGAQSWLMILPDQRMAIAININRKTSEFGEFAKVYQEIFDAFTEAQ